MSNHTYAIRMYMDTHICTCECKAFHLPADCYVDICKFKMELYLCKYTPKRCE